MDAVFLRSLERDDLERTHKWHNDQKLYENLVGTFSFVSSTTEEAWLDRLIAYSPNQVNLAICLTESGEHIGNTYLREIDWVARHGELHVFIAEPGQRSKGHGHGAIRLLAKHAFEELGLLRLYLFVLADNKPAIKVYEKSGFEIEGTLRKHAFKAGEFKDVLVMGLCSSRL